MRPVRPTLRAVRSLTAMGLLLAAISCRHAADAVVTELSDERWCDATAIRYANSDTLRLRELRLFLRLGDSFREDTLTLRVETFSPDRLRTREYHRIAPGTTRTAASVQRVVELPYRRDVRLQAAGDYYFVLTPVRPVEGVEAAGIRILTNR